MKISDRGLQLIRISEGLKLIAYPDPGTGAEPWTIGVGHTKGVRRGDVCTESEAMAWLREDCAEAEACVETWVEPDLAQHQFDALVSFVFNLGCGNFKGSTLLKLINAGNFGAAKAQFKKWNKAAGRVLAGLTTRRLAEAEMFSREVVA